VSATSGPGTLRKGIEMTHARHGILALTAALALLAVARAEEGALVRRSYDVAPLLPLSASAAPLIRESGIPAAERARLLARLLRRLPDVKWATAAVVASAEQRDALLDAAAKAGRPAVVLEGDRLAVLAPGAAHARLAAVLRRERAIRRPAAVRGDAGHRTISTGTPGASVRTSRDGRVVEIRADSRRPVEDACTRIRRLYAPDYGALGVRLILTPYDIPQYLPLDRLEAAGMDPALLSRVFLLLTGEEAWCPVGVRRGGAVDIRVNETLLSRSSVMVWDGDRVVIEAPKPMHDRFRVALEVLRALSRRH